MTVGEVIRAVATMKLYVVRGLFAVVAAALILASCSSSEPTSPASPTTESTATQADDTIGQDTTETVESGNDPVATPVPQRTLQDEDLAAIIDVQAGEQVTDANGNLVAIYGVAEWPASFQALDDATHGRFPFFGDVQAVSDPATSLLVLDVGMCAAGIDATGFGTAQFFVHETHTEVLSTDPVLDRGVLATHPVVQPAFTFPSAAECQRGYLPVLWHTSGTPQYARYVLATRQSATADVEQYVYQWELEPVTLDAGVEGAADPGDRFGIGQTVTFNQGPLDETTIVVDGWAELVGVASPIEGTRLVGVALDYCPASSSLAEFGIGVDGWNVVAPHDDTLLGAESADDPAASCFDGWLEFAIPFGGVPTSFFASDGANGVTGYAEWPLGAAALPAPQSG